MDVIHTIRDKSCKIIQSEILFIIYVYYLDNNDLKDSSSNVLILSGNFYFCILPEVYVTQDMYVTLLI